VFTPTTPGILAIRGQRAGEYARPPVGFSSTGLSRQNLELLVMFRAL